MSIWRTHKSNKWPFQFYACVCVHVCTHGVCVCVAVCVCTCVHVKVRGPPQVSSLRYHLPCFLDTVFHWNLPSRVTFPLAQHQDSKGIQPHPDFAMYLFILLSSNLHCAFPRRVYFTDCLSSPHFQFSVTDAAQWEGMG